jgi:hypothetical protein
MTTLTIESEPRLERVDFDERHVIVALADGRLISIPLARFPRLAYGTAEERSVYECWMDGAVVTWPLLDEHIHVKTFLAGTPSQESAVSVARWKEKLDDRRRQSSFAPWGQEHPIPE